MMFTKSTQGSAQQLKEENASVPVDTSDLMGRAVACGVAGVR